MTGKIEKLFEEQICAWPLLAKGTDGLAHARTRPVRIGSSQVYVRHIPHRLVSVTAKVDPASIQERPCFLCFNNLPPEEKGLQFNSEFSFFCNPFPILERHLTIVHRDHRPQQIADHFPTMLDLAKALPGYFIIYNGPECGASAPDHLHFQACSRRLFPIEGDTRGFAGPSVENHVRRILLFRERNRDHLILRLKTTVGALARLTAKSPEPLLNIALFFENSQWTVFVFPRGKHRPRVFYTGEITVSPGAIDLCGVLVVPREEDFTRITAADIEAIFQEVTIPGRQFEETLAVLEKSR
jgi:ATP adenylyltransferase/5',5'''-P-1,P-4-tetraphosphate phosphorylase II